jgi:hypothetical protein
MPVHLQQSPRDLQDIAKGVVANPTVATKAFHSSFAAPFRSAANSKGSFGSKVAAPLAQKGISIALSKIPVPVLNSLLQNAFDAACKAIRKKLHERHVEAPQNIAEKVKFELKDIADQFTDWDRYRWKVSHAAEEYNKVAKDVLEGINTAPCDTWVRVWSKYYYMGSRIAKLRASVEAVRAILLEVDVWLDSVEQSYSTTQQQVQSQFDKDIPQLKAMQVHDTCADNRCMFKQGQYNKAPSGAEDFFTMAASKAAAAAGGDDPIGKAIDLATSKLGG